MKFVRSVSLALVIAAVVAPAWSAQDGQHQGHHPADAKAAASTPSPNSVAAKSNPDMARMDTQMKAMRDMHSKLMAAKTLEERNALMAEHMKVMQDGMDMMKEMSPGGMSDMGMMNGMPSGDMGNMQGDMATCHQMMEKRMEMMQAMMQMMMDRLSAAPAK